MLLTAIKKQGFHYRELISVSSTFITFLVWKKLCRPCRSSNITLNKRLSDNTTSFVTSRDAWAPVNSHDPNFVARTFHSENCVLFRQTSRRPLVASSPHLVRNNKHTAAKVLAAKARRSGWRHSRWSDATTATSVSNIEAKSLRFEVQLRSGQVISITRTSILASRRSVSRFCTRLQSVLQSQSNYQTC